MKTLLGDSIRSTPAIVLAASLALAGCASGPARVDRVAPPGLRAPAAVSHAGAGMAGVPRFAEVEPGFARGGRPSAAGIRALAAGGYRTVVSLRHDAEERRLVGAAGMDYVELPMDAGPFGAPAPSEEQARAFLAVLDDSALRPLFVHCRRGRDRTGVMVALYRVARGGWSPAEAIQEMNERGMSAHYRAYRRFIRQGAAYALRAPD